MEENDFLMNRPAISMATRATSSVGGMLVGGVPCHTHSRAATHRPVDSPLVLG